MNKLALLFLTFFSLSAYAYVPPYWMILSRTSDNHGKGTYVIDQNIVFAHGTEPLVVNERWTIAGENSMRVEITGRRQLKDLVRMTYVYQNGRRYFLDESGAIRSERQPNEFFEPLFHYRLSKNIKPVLVAQGMAPAASLKSEPHKYSEKTPHAATENFVRLSRVGGTVAYAIGTPTPVESSQPNPGLWIEQDQFVIRKLRWPTQFEIQASEYKNFANGLWLPQLRTLSWPQVNSPVRVSVNSVGVAGSGKNLNQQLEPSSLKSADSSSALIRKLPEDAVIKEFYTRMR